MLPLAGAPMILRQIERVSRARRINRLVLATSVQASDDVLAATARDYGVAVHRGPLDDVRARFVGALAAFPAEHVVRLTGDCPLTDPLLIDACIDAHLADGADYTTNTPPDAGFAKGLDVEVVSAAALREAVAAVDGPQEREHVTWTFQMRPHLWRCAQVRPDVDESAVRWTVDRPDDYAFVSAVYAALHPQQPDFTSDDVRLFVRGRPDLANLGGDRRV